jgi:hypothetical protein
MSGTYDVGEAVRLSATFSRDGSPIDPTTLTLSIKRPDRTIVTYTTASPEMIHSATGSYHVDYIPTLAGRYLYYFMGTGAAQSTRQGWFMVRPLAF